MTRSELAVGRRFAEALAARDSSVALATAHAEIELWLPCTVLHGHAGLRQLLARASLDDGREIIVDDVVEIGDRLVALGRIDNQPVGAVIDVRHGRVARWQAFPDADDALAAATRRRVTTRPEATCTP